MPPGFRLTSLLRVIEMGRGTVAQFGERRRVGFGNCIPRLLLTFKSRNSNTKGNGESLTCRQSKCCISGLFICIYVHRTITVGGYDINLHPFC